MTHEHVGNRRFDFHLNGLGLLHGVIALVAILAVMAMSASAAQAVTPGQFFGMTTFNQLNSDNEAVELERLGVKRVRLNIVWRDFQQSNCSDQVETGISWSSFDQKVRRAAEHDIEILGDFYGTRMPSNCQNGADLHEFPMPSTQLYKDFVFQETSEYKGGFVWQVVQRYGQNGSFWYENSDLTPHPIKIWEVWNEPNFAENNPNNVVWPQGYGYLLVNTDAAIYNAQKALIGQNPENIGVKTLFGGIWDDPYAGNGASVNWTTEKYLDQVLNHREGYSWNDIYYAWEGLSYHPYRLRGSVQDVVNSIGGTVPMLSKLGVGGKELWITEIGWPVDFEHIEPEHNAQQVASMLNEVFNWTWANREYLNAQYAATFVYQDLPGSCNEAACWPTDAGIRDEGGTERPAWCTVANQIASNGNACEFAAPYLETQSATNVQSRNVTLNGKVNPRGLKAKYKFEWGKTTSYTNVNPAEGDAGWKPGDASFKETLTNLTPNTTYHYRLVAWSPGGTGYGSDNTFKTLAEPPSATTESATEVNAEKAKLKAKVNPNSFSTTYQFEYGPTTSYGSKAPISPGSAGSGTGDVSVEEVITGLSSSTTYHFRIAATSSEGTTYGKDGSFTTLAKPTVTTEGTTSAYVDKEVGKIALKGKVNPKGLATEYHFEWGTEAGKYPNSTSNASAGSGTSDVAVEQTIAGLKGKGKYFYRLVATNSGGTTNGAEKSFEAPDWSPVATTQPATDVAVSNAVLHGTVNPSGFATSYHFAWGDDAEFKKGEYNNLVPIPDGSIGSGTGGVSVSRTIGGLEASTVYHFRVVASNEMGTSYGKAETLTTIEMHSVHLAAESYPTVLGGQTTVDSAISTGSSVKCEGVDLQGQLPASGNDLALEAEYGQCTATLAGLPYPVTVEMNSCDYGLHLQNAGPPYSATLGVACDEEGDSIDYRFYLDQKHLENKEPMACTTEILPQEGLEGVGLDNVGEGTERGVTLDVDVKGMSWRKSCTGVTYEDWSLSAEATLTDVEDEVGVYLAHAPRFAAESYPTVLGDQTTVNSAITGGSSVKCAGVDLQGQLPSSGNDLALEAKYGQCTATLGGLPYPTTVEVNSCHLGLHLQNAGPPYSATLGVACDEEGDSIDYRFYLDQKHLEEKAVWCTAEILPQEGLEGVGLDNVGEGAERGVALDVEVKGMSWRKSCTGVTYKDWSLSAEATLTDVEEEAGVYLAGEELALGVYLAGEESEEEAAKPHLAAESYPTVFGGQTTLNAAVSAGSTVKCAGVDLQGQLPSSGNDLTLEAKYGQCTATIGGLPYPTAVVMNSCDYTLHVQNAGPPYSATLGVACDEEGDSIEYRFYVDQQHFEKDEPTPCTAEILPQEGLEGVDLANVGEGIGRGVTVDLDVEGMTWRKACTGVTYEDWSLSAEATLRGA